MINAILFILNLTIFGFFLTYFFKLKLLFEERIWTAFLLGTVTLGYFHLFLILFIKSPFLSLLGFLVTINLFSFYFLVKEDFLIIKKDFLDFKERLRQKSWITFLIFLSIMLLIFAFLASQLLIKKEGRLFVQPVHSYGDISLHLSIISSFAFGDNFPPQSPILSGTPISYPFLFDFITAIFVTPLSLEIEKAVSLTGVLMMIVVILSLAYFGLSWTRNKLAAILFLVIFALNGGLGFLIFLQDIFASSNTLVSLFNLQKDYTALKDIGFQWINVVISMFLPQRGFLLGISVGILILRIFWQLSDNFNKRTFILGSLLFSLLPIIHAHTMIALVPFLIWPNIKSIIRNKTIIPFVVLIGILSAVIIFSLSKTFLGQADNPLANIKFQLGWMANGENLLVFYTKNFGWSLILLPPLYILGIKHKLEVSYFALIGLIWFILPSFFIFQPWDFDNTKLFIYWYLSAALLIAHFLSRFLLNMNLYVVFFAIISIFLLTFSGGLDVIRLLQSSNTRFEVYSPNAINAAEFIKQNTQKNAVFLSVDKFDNPAVSLAGRKTVVGYHGWLWTYGLDYSQREKDVRLMLSGKADEILFKKYRISHVIFFNEPNNYEINKQYFYDHFQLIYNLDGYEIFKI